LFFRLELADVCLGSSNSGLPAPEPPPPPTWTLTYRANGALSDEFKVQRRDLFAGREACLHQLTKEYVPRLLVAQKAYGKNVQVQQTDERLTWQITYFGMPPERFEAWCQAGS